jgi:hypothetical protein
MGVFLLDQPAEVSEMGDLTWLPYVIAGVIIAIAAAFTFRRVPHDANRGNRPPDPPR